MDKPGAGQMPSVYLFIFFYHLGFNKAESEFRRIVIKHKGLKENPKLVPYIFAKITFPL